MTVEHKHLELYCSHAKGGFGEQKLASVPVQIVSEHGKVAAIFFGVMTMIPETLPNAREFYSPTDLMSGFTEIINHPLRMGFADPGLHEETAGEVRRMLGAVEAGRTTLHTLMTRGFLTELNGVSAFGAACDSHRKQREVV